MDKSKTELIALIRFGIQQLSARNGQMDFEHICRFFARARIHINILPATGPVQSGGDQGRDFETFHSYLAQSSIANTSFLGLFSEQPVAFACSLEQDPTRKNGKIDSDVKTILGGGVPVERIYFFSGQDIAVAKRHKAQERILKERSVEIDIIDANALAEHLSDSDLFWVASRYLDIPSEYFPLPEGPEWYAKLKKEYQQQKDDERRPTFQEFSEIKSALRRIYKDQDLKTDLPFWFNKLTLYLESDKVRSLKRKAIYEQFVAKLIGQNDVTGQEDLIRDYYSDFTEYRALAALEDATNLLSFVTGSLTLIGHSLHLGEITAWQDSLGKVLDEEYQMASDSGKKVWLCVLRAHFQLQITKGNNIFECFTAMLLRLKEAVPFFEEAFFYPFEDLSHFLSHILEKLLDVGLDLPIMDELESFARLVDDEVGRRHGDQKAGEQLKHRALQYFQKERYFEALDAFHRLKLKWTSADSPKGIVLAGIFIANCYDRLQMDYASRYYALAVAQVITNSEQVDLQQYLPKALSIVTEACYASGAWLSFVDILDLCIMTHMVATKDFELYDEHQQNVGIVFHPTIIRYVTQRLNLPSQHLFAHRFSKWGYIADEIEESMALAKPYYDKQSVAQLYEGLQSQLNDRPFNDLGLIRTIRFHIYGSQWAILFDNNYETNAAAEQLAAIIQILLVELENDELYLIKSSIQIAFSLKANIKFPEYKDLSSNENMHLKVYYPIVDSADNRIIQQAQAFYSALVVSILQQISLLPLYQLMAIVERKFDKGELVGRLLFVATYQNLYRNFFSRKVFEASARQHFTDAELFVHLQPRPNPELAWKDSLAPTYNREESLQTINNRLSFLYPYELTLPQLKASSEFKAVVNKLREKGWLDWQILISVGNLIVNYKIQQVSPFYDPAIAKERAFEFYSKPEKQWYIPIPKSILTVERIEKYLTTLQTVSVLQSFGLEFRAATPNFKAIFELLTQRFNYMIDGADVLVFD